MSTHGYAIDHIARCSRGLDHQTAPTLIYWGHGWGRDRQSFDGLIQSLATKAAHIAIDFPGFGASPLPPAPWGTAEYSDAVAALIGSYPRHNKIVWAGHSFGGRVGIQLAARHPELIKGLVLIAGAGLQRRRSVSEQIRRLSRMYTFKALKRLAPYLALDANALRERFGSADYRNAGQMRPTFLNVVSEDLTGVAKRIQCPTLLVYGARDEETPPEIGERLAHLIPRAQLSVLPNQDHYSLLASGRHLVATRIASFVERL